MDECFKTKWFIIYKYSEVFSVKRAFTRSNKIKERESQLIKALVYLHCFVSFSGENLKSGSN